MRATLRDGRGVVLSNDSVQVHLDHAVGLARYRLCPGPSGSYVVTFTRRLTPDRAVDTRDARAALRHQANASLGILIDQIGFDAGDAGTLAVGGRRYQRGSELYDVLLTEMALRNWLSGRARPGGMAETPLLTTESEAGAIPASSSVSL